MTHRRHFACAAIAILAVASPLQIAHAACLNAFKKGAVWHLHMIEVGEAPEAQAIRCVAKFGAAGNLTAPCVSLSAGENGQQNVSISGKVTLTATCDFSGSITVPGDAQVLVKYGHVNGNIGSAVGTQGAGADRRAVHVTLVKK